MKITPIQNNNPTSFKSVNLVQVSKKAFSNPEDLMDVSREFDYITKQITGEINSGLTRMLKFFGLGKKNKTITYLEQPAYAVIARELKSSGGYSISWLRQNTGIPIAEPLSPNHHSFIVLTKEQKNKVRPLFSNKNIYALMAKIIIEGSQKISNGTRSTIEGTWIAARINQLLSEKISPVIQGQPTHKFVIDDLSQLPKIFEQIEY